MPTDCPVTPDGSKRSVPCGADERNSVTMYTSEDNAHTFKQVSRTCFQVAHLSETELSCVLCTLLDQAPKDVQILHQGTGQMARPVEYARTLSQVPSSTHLCFALTVR